MSSIRRSGTKKEITQTRKESDIEQSLINKLTIDLQADAR